MRIAIRLNSDNPRDLRQLETLVAALKTAAPSAPPARRSRAAEIQKIKKLLTRRRTGTTLKKWVETFQPDEQVTLDRIGAMMEWNGRQTVAWVARLGATKRAWGLTVLRRHKRPGEPISYSMSRSIFAAVQRILVEQQKEATKTTPEVAPV